jgi:transketolase
VARRLEEKGVAARVLSMHTLKPLDGEAVLAAARETGAVVTLEQHSVIGGLGGAIAEWLAAQESVRAKLLAFGTPDAFMHEVGSTQYARDKFGLTATNIANSVESRLRVQATSC